MKKIILTGLLTAGLLVSTSGVTFAGSLRDCIIEKGSMELTEGQMALLRAHGDMKINILSTAKEYNLDVPDVVAVHHLMVSAGISCVLGQ